MDSIKLFLLLSSLIVFYLITNKSNQVNCQNESTSTTTGTLKLVKNSIADLNGSTKTAPKINCIRKPDQWKYFWIGILVGLVFAGLGVLASEFFKQEN